ncbi:MAG: hypothetical protein U9Q71_02050 [Pseudomonadota bacterium]|nr:hypothetical protein [Pseudomonadota bacterium]
MIEHIDHFHHGVTLADLGQREEALDAAREAVDLLTLIEKTKAG